MEGPAVELNAVFQILQSGAGVIGKTRGISGRIPGIGGKDGGNAEGESMVRDSTSRDVFLNFITARILSSIPLTQKELQNGTD